MRTSRPGCGCRSEREAWAVTRYADVVTVLHRFRAARTPAPERLDELGMGEIGPIAAVMITQMLFLDQPEHGRVRPLASVAFTPRRVARLRDHIRQITEDLIDELAAGGEFDVISRPANPLPAIVPADARGADQRSRAAQVVVPGLRRDARQLPVQPGASGQGAQER